MPVFSRGDQKILFVHIPKTGGTYVEDLFRANGFQVDFWKPNRLKPVEAISPQHYHAAILAQIFDLSAFDYIFTCVRAPFDRLVSEYKMRCPNGEQAFDRWADETLKTAINDPSYLDNHLRPQSQYLLPNIGIYRQENGFGEQFAATVAQKAGIELKVKSVPRRRDNRAWREAQTNLTLAPDTQKLFDALYQSDFDHLGYDRPSVITK